MHTTANKAEKPRREALRILLRRPKAISVSCAHGALPRSAGISVDGSNLPSDILSMPSFLTA
jgi:hypothetical protein